MEKLCANIAYSRRAARRLRLCAVATQLSQLLQEVRQMQKDCCDHVDTDAPKQKSSVEASSGNADISPVMGLRKASGPDKPLVRAKEQVGHEIANSQPDLHEPRVASGTTTTSHFSGGPLPIAVSDILSEEYEEQSLRMMIRPALQSASAADRSSAIQAMCQQSLEALSQASAKPLVVQVAYARLHVVCLEERLAIDGIAT